MSKKLPPAIFTAEEQRTLRNGIREVWNAIGQDVEAHCDNDNECAVESCIDANRLTEFCFDTAEGQRLEAVINTAVKQHGYPAVLTALSNIAPLV